MPKYARDRVFNVIEHGCGGYSSPVIDHFCKQLEIQRIVVETNEAWATEYKLCALHYNSVDSFAAWRGQIGLALIDGDQHDRQRMIELCKDALFIVVHDTEMMELYRYDFKGFKVLETSVGLLPQTTVLQRE